MKINWKSWKVRAGLAALGLLFALNIYLHMFSPDCMSQFRNVEEPGLDYLNKRCSYLGGLVTEELYKSGEDDLYVHGSFNRKIVLHHGKPDALGYPASISQTLNHKH